MLSTKEVVVLVPGFMGFDSIGDFPYFSDSFVAGLCGAITSIRGEYVPVVPVSTLPTDALAERQSHLYSSLKNINAFYPNVEAVHLVGHSTGGLDAQLLLAEEPLSPELDVFWDWHDHRIRKQIKTSLGIASPYWGTLLTTSSLVRFLEKPYLHIEGLLPLLKSMGLLLGSIDQDDMARKALLGALADVRSAGRYLLEAVTSRELMHDLRPSPMSLVQQNYKKGIEEANIRSIVTMVAQHTDSLRCETGIRLGNRLRLPDAFFEALYSFTAEGDDDLHPPANDHIDKATQTIEAATQDSSLLIKNEDAYLYGVTTELNDGIVNTVRQLVNPEDPDELVAVVVGDHLDVIGYYPNWSPSSEVSDDKNWVLHKDGLLHSGSGFEGPQFHQMIHAIAQALIPA